MPDVSVLFVFGGTSGLILEHASIQGVKWPQPDDQGVCLRECQWGWGPFLKMGMGPQIIAI